MELTQVFCLAVQPNLHDFPSTIAKSPVSASYSLNCMSGMERDSGDLYPSPCWSLDLPQSGVIALVCLIRLHRMRPHVIISPAAHMTHSEWMAYVRLKKQTVFSDIRNSVLQTNSDW